MQSVRQTQAHARFAGLTYSRRGADPISHQCANRVTHPRKIRGLLYGVCIEHEHAELMAAQLTASELNRAPCSVTAPIARPGS